VHLGDVGVEGDGGIELGDGVGVVAGDFEHVAARPMRLEQVGFKGEGSAGLFDGEVDGVELLDAGFNAQSEDVGEDGMRQAAVLIELDSTAGV
jgi:hypothetical protein